MFDDDLQVDDDLAHGHDVRPVPEVLQVLVDHNQANINNNAALKVDFTVLDDEFRQTILHQIIRKPRLNKNELNISRYPASSYIFFCIFI